MATLPPIFVPERHFIGPDGLPATLQNTQVHPPVPNDWFEKYGLHIEDADVLDQDPDKDGFTNLDEWQAGTDRHAPWDSALIAPGGVPRPAFGVLVREHDERVAEFEFGMADRAVAGDRGDEREGHTATGALIAEWCR